MSSNKKKKALPKRRKQKQSVAHPLPQYTITPGGQKFLEMLTDPLGQSDGRAPKFRSAPYPDAQPNTVTICYKSVFHITLSVVGGAIEFVLPSTTSGGGIRGVTGGDPFNAASSPTATTHAYVEPSCQPYMAWFRDADRHYRLLSAAINVQYTGAPEYSSGRIQGAHKLLPLQTGAVSWSSYADLSNNLAGASYPLSEGVTVRSLFGDANASWHSPEDDLYSNIAGVRIPAVAYGSNHVSGTVQVTAVMHLQIKLPDLDWPGLPSPVVFQPDIGRLLAIANAGATTSSGASFRGFLQSMKKVIIGGSRFAIDNRDWLIPMAKAIAALV